MKRDYLGDSYDAVKRLWQQVLADVAPLYAEPRFLAIDLREDFTRLTDIRVLIPPISGQFSILNDPDTGIRLPGEVNQKEGRKHITLATIAKQLREQGPHCVITFDQSNYRHLALKPTEQRQAKLRSLRENGFVGFYYVSHAPFLFAFNSIEVLQEVKARLVSAGIPTDRFEREQE